MNVLTFDVALAAKLKKAFARSGWDESDINRLAESPELAGVRNFLRGHASIVAAEHVIDCDADPFVPGGWSVSEHQKAGSFQWDASKVELWLASDQKNCYDLDGHKIRRQVAKKVPFNANVLDYLLANPHLIPEEWKSVRVFFWGTLYFPPGRFVCVRCLLWKDGRWGWGRRWYGANFGGKDPALLRAS